MLLIKNAAVSTGEGNKTRLVDIHVDGEKITKIVEIDDTPSPFPPPSRGRVRERGIDAKGLLALPGAIDPHVHFDTPGFEYREDFAHGSMSAIAGGVTTVIDMPCTSMPPVTSLANLENKLKFIEPQAYADFALWGGVSQNLMRGESSSPLCGPAFRKPRRGAGERGDWFSAMDELLDADVVGFKVYMISGLDTYRALSYMEIGQVMQYAHKIGALIGIHAEDSKMIYERMESLKKNNKNSLDDYYSSRADPAEKNGVLQTIGLAHQTKASLHIVHVASGSAARLIQTWKLKGLDITCETCPHYLTFTHKDFKKYGSLIKTAPVIKKKKDKEILWKLLSDSGIDFLSTDHAPCQLSEKQTGSAWTDYGGMPGVELILPFAFSEGYQKRKLTLARLIEVTSTSAARRFGLYPAKGALKAGSDADIVLIDPKKKWKVRADSLHSKAKWTPFDGCEFKGKVIYTILRGKIVYTEDYGIVNPPSGKLIHR